MINNKILFIGNSLFFIELFSELFPNHIYDILPFRNINKFESYGLDSEYDLIVICGYNYSTYLNRYCYYYESNVDQVIIYLENIKSCRHIYYINTDFPKRRITFSRYLFAKHSLASKLKAFKFKLSIISIPTIIDNNTVKIHGGYFSTALFSLAFKFNLIKTINKKGVADLIANASSGVTLCPKLDPLRPAFLNIPRSIFIDRILRLLYG